jgi:hypothetical protein
MIIKCEYHVRKIESKEFEVDDRIFNEDDMSWKIANIILEKRLKNLQDDMYSDNVSHVSYTIEKINEAFSMADEIIKL